MLDPERIKAQLRLSDEEFSEQAPLLTAYGRAAWRLVETTINRRLYSVPIEGGETPEELAALLPDDAPDGALAADEDLLLAMLLLVAHWDRNREAVAEDGAVAPQDMPLAFAALTGPYRIINL